MISEALASVRSRIAAAAARAGRDAEEVSLVAVTKVVDVARIREAVALGVTDLGESRVQELRQKQQELAELPVRWHLVGTLQRNKVHHVAGRVTLIHSVDSRRLAEDIGNYAARADAVQDVLLEVNVAGEPTKRGVTSEDAHEVARGLLDIEGVRLRGFMTIAPAGDPLRARAAFAALRGLRDRTADVIADATELSMGMSDDFEIAIEEGATIVRIGTAIFGERAPDAERSGTVPGQGG
ncbi:MAG: YggS family pyridoxal phosphate-dependent enzyme [Actinomycetota bacterium]